MVQESIHAVENNGIVFLDEIDKICVRDGRTGGDVSREGVQRDLLPLIEGTTVSTKHGAVKTDHILFIASGAFHIAKPSDLLPELQGRLPIRVELEALTRDDMRRILTEPEASLIKQYVALMQTEGVTLDITPEAIDALADVAVAVNSTVENIGARRLQTVMERVLDEISFAAPDRNGETIRVDADYVRSMSAISPRTPISAGLFCSALPANRRPCESRDPYAQPFEVGKGLTITYLDCEVTAYRILISQGRRREHCKPHLHRVIVPADLILFRCLMNLRVWENPWRLMLAVNAAVLIGVFLYKITREPYVPYIHLLVDYHFGFAKRALIGAVTALFFTKVPIWLVFALSGAVWLITLGLFANYSAERSASTISTCRCSYSWRARRSF